MTTHRVGILLAALMFGGGPAAAACTGDCDGDGQVAINEAVRGVNIALGNTPVAECAQFDANGDGSVAVNELIGAVAAVLDGCPDVTPGPKPRATPDPDGPATLVIEEGAGNELITGRAYGFKLNELRDGLRLALYYGLRDERRPDTHGDIRLTQSILDVDGNPVFDDTGRRLIVNLHFRHLPLRTGTFRCGEGVPEAPGSLLTFDVSATARNDELFMETAIDDYFSYPLVTTSVNCSITISSIDDGLLVATYDAHMTNPMVDDLLHATGFLRVPLPTCDYQEFQASPQTCFPWAF